MTDRVAIPDWRPESCEKEACPAPDGDCLHLHGAGHFGCRFGPYRNMNDQIERRCYNRRVSPESELIALRPEIQRFAETMEANMRAHDEMRGDAWKSEDAHWLLERLGSEVSELHAAVDDCAHDARFQDPTADEFAAVASEAADVGNFAMMIAFLLTPHGGTET